MTDSGKKLPMAGWYDVRHLVPTAVRVVISEIFGQFNDGREAQASGRPIDQQALDPAYDYSAEDGLVFDFLADTGDGWEATYAVAWMAAQPALEVGDAGKEILPRGRFLILGGDQVYPAADRDAYKVRFVTPFSEALPAGAVANGPAPDLYAIPGNHDWYDGLNSFLGLFCARRGGAAWGERPGRRIGGWQTQQTRSYFALKLPGDWWIWAIDVQLTGYVDQPQLDYFAHVAKRWMVDAGGEPRSMNVILCTAQPDWLFEEDNPGAYRQIDYVAGILRQHGHALRAVLTGDMHNYNRYEDRTSGVQYVTAGGGGAFLHPTAHLKDRVGFATPSGAAVDLHLAERAGGGPALFPDRAASRGMAWENLKFPLRNPGFGLLFAAIYGLLGWLLDASARASGSTGLDALGTVDGTLALLWRTPGAALLLAGITLAYVGFAAYRPLAARVAAGMAHAALQIGVVFLAVGLLGRYAVPAEGVGGVAKSAIFIAALGVWGGLWSAFLMGLYLLYSLNRRGRHWNEAFSSLRSPHYKHIVRFRHLAATGDIEASVLGIAKVPRAGWWRRHEGETAHSVHMPPSPGEPAVRLVDRFVLRGTRGAPSGGAGDVAARPAEATA